MGSNFKKFIAVDLSNEDISSNDENQKQVDSGIHRVFDLNQNSKGETKNIPLSNIVPNPKNVRNGDSWKKGMELDSLVESIETIGLQQNLVIRRKYDDEDIATEYVLLSGHRRYEALKRLHERYPGEISYAQPLCLILNIEENGLFDKYTLEELAIATTNVEVKTLSNDELLKSILAYEKAYEEVRQKAIALREEVINPVTGKPNRGLTKEEENLLYYSSGKSRDFISKAMNISPRKIGNLKLLNKKLIKSLLDSFKKNELQTDVGLILANEGIQAQRAFVEQNTKPLGEIKKTDVELFIKSFKKNKNKNVQTEQAVDEEITIKPRAELQKAVKTLKNQDYTLIPDDYIKYLKSKEKIDKEIKKIEKMLAKY